MSTKLSPKAGSITFAGLGGDFASFDLEGRQQVDDTTGYDETTFGDVSGSGVANYGLDFTGFCVKGAAGSALGMASALTDTPAAVVMTLDDDGCTESGNFVLETLRVSHRKGAGAVPFMGHALSKLTLAEAWVNA